MPSDCDGTDLSGARNLSWAFVSSRLIVDDFFDASNVDNFIGGWRAGDAIVNVATAFARFDGVFLDGVVDESFDEISLDNDAVTEVVFFEFLFDFVVGRNDFVD